MVYLWKFLWNKIQSSLHYVKIALCAIVAYLLILTIFARVFQNNKVALYPTQSVTNSRDQIRNFITDKKMNSTKAGRITISFYKNISCKLVGEACYADLDKKNPSNASMFLASLFVYPLLHPPASGIGAVQQTLAQVGFIPKSYAAEGVGFASMRPLMKVWTAMRDISYLLLVLVIVTIGFMIMLRSKINPQTIVSVENALPKIVMALIYITFSFAIAGLLIDLMYVSLVLVIGILGPIQPNATPESISKLTSTFLMASPWSLFTVLGMDGIKGTAMIFAVLPNAILAILGGYIGNILRLVIFIAATIFVNPFITQTIAWVKAIDVPIQGSIVFASITISGLVKSFLEAAGGFLSIGLSMAVGALITLLIIGLLIFLTVLMLFFRIFMLLFSNYIKLLVLIIISPLFLLMEAVPGQSTFGSWIKNLLELLVPYPIIVASFLIGSIIMDTSTRGVLWTPPFLFEINGAYLSAIIGMWILFMIPDFISLVQKMVNPKPLPLEAGLGTFFGGAKTGVETGLGEMSKYALLAGQFAPLKRVFNMIPGFEKK